MLRRMICMVKIAHILPTACIMMRNCFIINLIRQKAILVSFFPYKSCMDVYGCALSSMVATGKLHAILLIV